MKTAVKIEEHEKYGVMFVVQELDDKGEAKQYPVVKFGIKKAKAILKHANELKKFVEENEK